MWLGRAHRYNRTKGLHRSFGLIFAPDMTVNFLFRQAGTSVNALSQRLHTPVDIASLAYLRIAFYALMLWEASRIIGHDWIGRYFSGQEFYFKYWLLDFVQPWQCELD